MEFKKWDSTTSLVCTELRNEHNSAIDEIERLKAENDKLDKDLLCEQAQKVDWERLGKRQELYERGDVIYALRDEVKELVDNASIEDLQIVRDILTKK